MREQRLACAGDAAQADRLRERRLLLDVRGPRRQAVAVALPVRHLLPDGLLAEAALLELRRPPGAVGDGVREQRLACAGDAAPADREVRRLALRKALPLTS